MAGYFAAVKRLVSKEKNGRWLEKAMLESRKVDLYRRVSECIRKEPRHAVLNEP